MDEFYLPSIETKYQRTGERKDYAPIFYQNKPFKLPKVEGNTLYPLAPVPKTYTTRKGALLLYAEDYFIPGSPKMSRRKKKKPKRQSAVIFKTLGDLRNSILNYKKNGVSKKKINILKIFKLLMVTYLSSHWGVKNSHYKTNENIKNIYVKQIRVL